MNSALRRHVLSHLAHLCADHAQDSSSGAHDVGARLDGGNAECSVVRALASARRRRQGLAVLILGLDRFKTMSDSLGSKTVDFLLSHVVSRIGAMLRSGDIITCREKGEVIVLIESTVQTSDVLLYLARGMLDQIALPVHVDGRRLFASASIGMSMYPEHGDTAGALLDKAAAALDLGRGDGGNNIRMFTDAMRAAAEHAFRFDQDLRQAIAEEQFTLAYQPIVDIEGGQLLSVEALLRWRLPDGRSISPQEFIPVAERSGLILPIGQWVLRQACRQILAWRRATGVDIPVSVNLSPRQFSMPDIAGSILGAIRETGLDPSMIEMEITETSLMQNIEDGAAALALLAEGGVKLAIDDFGTGYSSLHCLRKLPVNAIKIDRSFVRDLHTDADAVSVVHAIIGLAKRLGLRTVAEGIETDEQLAILKNLGCARGQGFYLSKPVCPERIEQMLRRARARTILKAGTCDGAEITPATHAAP